jgi:hypothetical protein
MARLSFRDRFLTPGVARAIMSPLSILVFGIATAGTILLGLPIAAAAAVGAGAYGVKVLAAMPRSRKKDQSRVDAFVLSEPWRGYIQGAQSAKLRFDRTVAGTGAGPIRDRLTELGTRLDDGIMEAWRIASRGDDIDAAIGQLDTTEAIANLAQLRAQARQGVTTSDMASTIESLEAQIASAERMQTVSSTTRDRLRLLDARFDELVARAVEVSVGAGDSGELGDDVNNLVAELEGLRLAMEDTKRADRGDLSPAPAVVQATPIVVEPEQKPQTWPPQ